MNLLPKHFFRDLAILCRRHEAGISTAGAMRIVIDGQEFGRFSCEDGELHVFSPSKSGEEEQALLVIEKGGVEHEYEDLEPTNLPPQKAEKCGRCKNPITSERRELRRHAVTGKLMAYCCVECGNEDSDVQERLIEAGTRKRYVIPGAS